MTDLEHLDPTSAAEPRYWVPKTEVTARISDRLYLFGFRDAVSAVADSRSLLASILPAFGAGHTILFLYTDNAINLTFLLAWFNTFMTDYMFRLKSSGGHASFFLLKQLPLPGTDAAYALCQWRPKQSAIDWIVPRVLELTYTAWDLAPFARDCGYDGPPFRWDDSRRFLLRCELDAAFFHLYGINGDDAAFILDTFPIIRKKDEARHGEYRTKRGILEIYDRMAEAIRTGVPYQTLLDPPPADPRVAHRPT